MNTLSKAHKKFLLRLSEMKVEFMLIGGYAVIYHGYPRLTMDMDVWIKPDNENKLKLIAALRSYGIVEEDLEKVSARDFTKSQSFFIGEKKNKIDFLTSISGISYQDADKQKVFLKVDDTDIPVIQFQHLIVNKMISGRPQDKADVDMLQKVRRHKKE